MASSQQHLASYIVLLQYNWGPAYTLQPTRQTQSHHSNILTWAKTWKQHNQKKNKYKNKKNHDRISAILHFLSCSKVLTAISLALTEEARNFLPLSGFCCHFLSNFYHLGSFWCCLGSFYYCLGSCSFPFICKLQSAVNPAFIAPNGQLHSHTYKWDYQSNERKGTWEQPVHKLKTKITFCPYIFRGFPLWSLDFIFTVFSPYPKKRFPFWFLPLHQRRKMHTWQTAELKKYYKYFILFQNKIKF